MTLPRCVWRRAVGPSSVGRSAPDGGSFLLPGRATLIIAADGLADWLAGWIAGWWSTLTVCFSGLTDEPRRPANRFVTRPVSRVPHIMDLRSKYQIHFRLRGKARHRNHGGTESWKVGWGLRKVYPDAEALYTILIISIPLWLSLGTKKFTYSNVTGPQQGLGLL